MWAPCPRGNVASFVVERKQMASMNARLDAGLLNKEVTMNVVVTGMRTVKARWWLAMHVLKLARLIAGCHMSIEIGPQ